MRITRACEKISAKKEELLFVEDFPKMNKTNPLFDHYNWLYE